MAEKRKDDQPRRADGRWAPVCEDCLREPVEWPGEVCPGCAAYREHQA